MWIEIFNSQNNRIRWIRIVRIVRLSEMLEWLYSRILGLSDSRNCWIIGLSDSQIVGWSSSRTVGKLLEYQNCWTVNLSEMSDRLI